MPIFGLSGRWKNTVLHCAEAARGLGFAAPKIERIIVN
jgi:hypothetical protein